MVVATKDAEAWRAIMHSWPTTREMTTTLSSVFFGKKLVVGGRRLACMCGVPGEDEGRRAKTFSVIRVDFPVVPKPHQPNLVLVRINNGNDVVEDRASMHTNYKCRLRGECVGNCHWLYK
jgi:hypothetical protein